MVNEGKGDRAAQIFAQIAREADAQGISLEKVEALMPAYTDADDKRNMTRLVSDDQYRLAAPVKLTVFGDAYVLR